MLSKKSGRKGLSGAPPQMMPSSSPPNVDVTDLNSFLRISMPTLSIALDTLISLRSMPALPVSSALSQMPR